MQLLDIVIVVVYLGGIAALGFYFSRKQKTTEDYFLAGRNLPGWVLAFSFLGTICSSATFVGHPGNVFHENMYLIPAHVIPLIVMVLVVRHVVVYYRRTLKMTSYEFLEHRFGYPARAYGAGTFLISRVSDVSVTYYFLALAAAYLTDWSVSTVIILLGAVTVLYTLLGGIEAVAWTDVIQGTFLVGGGVLCIALILFGAEATPAEVIRNAWDGGKFEIGRWEWETSTNNQWFYLIGAPVVWLQSFACNQQSVQRYLSARSDREAIRGATMGAAACVPVWLLFMTLGALLWSYYNLGTEQIPEDVMAIKDRIVPYFIKTHFPAGLKGLILAALIAAAMSSLDSDLNAMATVVVNDFYTRIRPRSSDAQRLRAGRWSVVVLGVASIALALQWTNVSNASLVEMFFTMGMIVTGGILGLFALGTLFGRTTPRGAYTGIFACVLFTGWATLSQLTMPGSETPVLDLGRFNYTLSPLMIGVIGHVVLVVVAVIATPLLGSRRVQP